MTWEEALELFLLQKRSEGRAALTLRDYRRHITAFFASCSAPLSNESELRRAILHHFSTLQVSSPTHFNLRREYLRAFFHWCRAEGYIKTDVMRGIARRKNDGACRHVDAHVLKRLLAAPDRRTYVGLRDYALMLVQLDCGLRPGEALQLTPADVRLDALEIHVPSTVAKTRTSRTVVMSIQTAKAIRKLTSARPEDWTDDVPLFASVNGRRLSETKWAARLQQYSEQIGVRVTPYMLRHSSAIMYLRNGGNVFGLQRQLGHASISMTKRYVHLADEDLHQQHAIASPVASLLPNRTRAGRVR